MKLYGAPLCMGHIPRLAKILKEKTNKKGKGGSNLLPTNNPHGFLKITSHLLVLRLSEDE